MKTGKRIIRIATKNFTEQLILGEMMDQLIEKKTDLIVEHRFAIQWLKPFGFNNTYAITVRKADAKKNKWNRISDLEDIAIELRAGFTAEFAERPDGYPGLRRIYGLRFGEVRDFDPALMYEAVDKEEVDVICVFATDGRIAAYNYKPFNDERNFFPPYQAAPVVRGEIMKTHPKLGDVLSLYGGQIIEAKIRKVKNSKKLPAGNLQKIIGRGERI